MTLEELIEEGNTFKMINVEAHLEPAGYFQLKKVPASNYLENPDKFSAWIQKSKRFLIQNYPNDCSIDSFNNIAIDEITLGKIYDLVGVLIGLKEFPSICETKKDTPTNVQNINVSQSQNQSQNINIVLQAIKDAFSPNDIKDLKDIEGDTEEAKKQNLLSKLKGFGEATLSNILANIITNPTIWEQLFK